MRADLRDVMKGDDWTASMVRKLCELVGGIDALEQLDDLPLPNAPFDWTLVAENARATVNQVLTAMDDRVPDWFGPEYQRVTHRLLERILVHDPSSLDRSTPIRTAAAITWLALIGNGAIDGRRGSRASTVWAVFGVTSCVDRGRGLFKALGLPARTPSHTGHVNRYDIWLCERGLLHSATRRDLLDRRETTIAVLAQEARRRVDEHPIKQMADGNLRISSRSVTPRWAMRTPNSSGREIVLTTFGDTEDKPEVLTLSIPNARFLVNLLTDALDSPRPTVVD
jgi:hypothetical protein